MIPPHGWGRKRRPQKRPRGVKGGMDARRVKYALAAGVVLGLAAPAHAQDTTLSCFAAKADTVERIANCTEAIRGPGLTADTRSLALITRAQAYVTAGDSGKAIADFDAALV